MLNIPSASFYLSNGDEFQAIKVKLHEHHGISNHWQLNCLLVQPNNSNNKTLKLCITCEGYPLVTGGFPPQRVGNVIMLYYQAV